MRAGAVRVDAAHDYEVTTIKIMMTWAVWVAGESGNGQEDSWV